MKRAFLISIVAGLLAVAPAHAFDSAIVAGQMPAMTGDCTTPLGAVALTCTKTNGVAFTNSATTDTTNAANITAGTLAVARGGTGDTGTAWAAYTPTVSSGTGTLTTASATGRFKQIGKTVFFQATVIITTNGTGASNIQIGIPVTAGAGKYPVPGFESGLTAKQLSGIINPGASMAVVNFYDGTYPGGNGSSPVINGVYEAQ